MTIDEAIDKLVIAKERIGGDKHIIICERFGVDGMTVLGPSWGNGPSFLNIESEIPEYYDEDDEY